MGENLANIHTVCRVLELFGIAHKVSENDISNFKVFKSAEYGMQNIYSFDFNGRHYYVSDDYSLCDNPDYLRNVIEEINPFLKGRAIASQSAQIDGSKYAVRHGSKDFYLWGSGKV